jgi:hypothetical protein
MAAANSPTYEEASLEVPHGDDTSCDTVVITAAKQQGRQEELTAIQGLVAELASHRSTRHYSSRFIIYQIMESHATYPNSRPPDAATMAIITCDQQQQPGQQVSTTWRAQCGMQESYLPQQKLSDHCIARHGCRPLLQSPRQPYRKSAVKVLLCSH